MARTIYGLIGSGSTDVDHFEIGVQIKRDTLDFFFTGEMKCLSETVILYRKDNNEELTRFSIPTPIDYDLTEDNALDYVKFVATRFGEVDGDHVSPRMTEFYRVIYRAKHPEHTEPGKNYPKVKIKVVHTGNVSSFRFYEDGVPKFKVTQDGEAEGYTHQRKGWAYRNAMIISHEFDEDIRHIVLSITHTQMRLLVHLEPNDGEISGNRKIYSIDMKDPLDARTTSRMSLGMEAKPVSSEWYVDNSEAKPESLTLIWRSIGDFHYLETSDGKLKLSLGRTGLDAIQGLHKEIDASDLTDDEKKAHKAKFGSILVKYLEGAKKNQQDVITIRTVIGYDQHRIDWTARHVS